MAHTIIVVAHVSSAYRGKQVVCLLVQAGYVIQNVLHLAGSVGPDTARKLSLKSACWYKQFWKCLVKAGYSTLKYLLVQAGSYVSAWLSRIFSNTVLVGYKQVYKRLKKRGTKHRSVWGHLQDYIILLRIFNTKVLVGKSRFRSVWYKQNIQHQSVQAGVHGGIVHASVWKGFHLLASVQLKRGLHLRKITRLEFVEMRELMPEMWWREEEVARSTLTLSR